MALITVEQAVGHLRLDFEGANASPPYSTDDRYDNLVMKMSQAEAIILNYLKVDADASIDGDPDASPPIAPLWGARDRSNVQAAALFALDALYDDSDGRTLANYMAPLGVITLLVARLRDPAFA